MKPITTITLILVSIILMIVLVYQIASFEKSSQLLVEYDVALPITNMTNVQIVMHDYRNAVDVNWSTLYHFLMTDDTYKNLYSYPNFVCSDFARKLHNNAEENGIKCGIVAIKFDQRAIDPRWNSTGVYNLVPLKLLGVGHALNVFLTTDRGTVYVDLTNDGNHTGVKIGYLEMGQEYSVLPISLAQQFNYAYYQQIRDRYFSYNEKFSNYTKDVEQFNKEADQYNLTPSLSEYYILKPRENQLDQERQHIMSMEEANWQLFYPPGYVNKIDIYW